MERPGGFRIYSTRKKSKMKQLVLANESERLFERIVDLDNLRKAYKAVRRNKGAPGIDGVTVEAYGETLGEKLSQLQQEVLSWTYEPRPVKRVRIPKPGNQGERLLGIPRVHDRVLQTAIKQVLEPIYETKFSDSSFGFRPGRNQHQAIRRAQQIVKSGHKIVVDIDLSKFFDRINHDLLINRLRQQVMDTRVLRLIGKTLRSGIMENGLVHYNPEGSVQGSPLSPLLSNIVLDELDKELEKRGLKFCRFADDCNIFVGSQTAGTRVMASIKRFIESRLKLKINTEKSQVAPTRMVKFLGFTITGTAIAISRSAMVKAFDKVRDLTPRGSHQSIELTVKKINSWYCGWSNYFKLSQFSQQFNTIEAHLRRRLRARLVSYHKRDRFLYRKLRDRGVSHKAAKSIFGNQRTWARSNAIGVNQAWPNDWFHKTLGMHTVFTDWQKHWFKRSRSPHLP